jgi:hypothetical protein
MEKQVKRFKQPFSFDWTYGVELKKIKEDINELEKLGVTEINIEAYDNYGSPSVNIEAFIHRIETDEEFIERFNKQKKQQDETERRELELLEKLKSKYGK